MDYNFIDLNLFSLILEGFYKDNDRIIKVISGIPQEFLSEFFLKYYF